MGLDQLYQNSAHGSRVQERHQMASSTRPRFSIDELDSRIGKARYCLVDILDQDGDMMQSVAPF